MCIRDRDWKAGEYTAGQDRLLNFKQVAEFLSQRPAEVALAYLLKHIQSVALAVQSKKYAWTWETESGEGLKQRIADARNYLCLLYTSGGACGRSKEVGNPGSETERTAQPGMGGVLDGLPSGLAGHRWPAGPGPQHPWEPPRDVYKRQGIRL